ncbi:hypothetical protein M0811_11499 [Anaeramoeba ignava]|uniref:F-box domain-containing protein n=1 Tax=Anaeramoeba ignava TaxID=1746090 RepID=A0A9Q0R785_ANAIG|nr:hypothetical protein M0811_11499 [Anaeramoeba ignava]
MNIFETINYKSKQVIKIGKEHLNELKRGEYCEFAEYLKLSPLKENLILEMLPEEVLLYIFQYLSPGDLIRVASTCTTLNELSQDINTWRIITYNYNQFLILKEIEFEKEIIETKPNLSSFFRRRRNEDPFIISLEENEIERNLIEYIEKIPNPQKEIISKAKLIYNAILQRKQQKKLLKQFKERLFPFLFLLFAIITTFIILINVYIDNNLSSNILYFFIPLFIAILITIPFLFYLFKFLQDSKFSIYGIGTAILFIEVLLIGLRIETTIKGSWLLIFIPFFIFIGFIIIYYINLILKKNDLFYKLLLLLSIFVLFLIFLILLGLRLDETIKWNYGIIFIPFFLINLVPLVYNWLLFLVQNLIPFCVGFLTDIPVCFEK